MTFADLADAGRALAAQLGPAPAGDVVIVAVAPAGIPVALAVATAWRCPVVEAVVVRGESVRVEPLPDLGAARVVVVDDGVETGTAARAVAAAARAAGASVVVLAVPVCPRQSEAALSPVFDDIVAVERPLGVRSLRWHYADLTPPDRAEARRRLAEHAASLG